MSKKSLTLRDLIELINISVKSGKIKKDYHDFLKSCRDLGVSSYVLNTIILRAKEDSRKYDDNYVGTIDHTFFVSLEPEEEQPEDSSEKEQEVKNERRKTSKTARLVVLFLSCLCVANLVYLSIHMRKTNKIISDYKNKGFVNGSRLEKLEKDYMECWRKLDTIADLTSELPDDAIFDNWHSTNHENNSESYKNYSFYASEGDVLSFKYDVSSEFGCDYLTVTLKGENISSIELVKKSGKYQNSRVFAFEKNGVYNLEVKYSKDGSFYDNDDDAGVSDIYLYRSYKNLIEKINSISTDSLSDTVAISSDLY